MLLLPHGYEGQGPEHSSARLERYLQLCAEDNMQVCNLTTAANYFHALRRQMRRNFRKPLVIVDAEIAAARHGGRLAARRRWGRARPSTASSTRSRPIAPDDKVRRVVLCSGKVYFDLRRGARARTRRSTDVAMMRLEQLYPFPFSSARQGAGALPQRRGRVVPGGAAEHGRLEFRRPPHRARAGRLDIAAKRPRYVGRAEAASPATGLFKRHAEEQARLVDDALAA